MKGFLITLFFVLACAYAHGQAANQVIANDTVKGAQTKYLTGTKGAANYIGVVGFTFTTSHDNAKFYLQGCYNTSAWQTIDSVIVTGATSVERILYQSPPKYFNYRIKEVGSTGDTCRVLNIRYFLKY